MDINQLKLILDSVKDVSELTAGVAILWILVSQILPYAIGAYAIYTASRILSHFFGTGILSSEDTRTIRGIRDSMIPSQAGTYFDIRERAAVQRRLTSLKEAGMFEPIPQPCQEIPVANACIRV